MAIPAAGLYPTQFDADTNLYLVHDFLRVKLAEDYIPSNSSITIEGNIDIIRRFPPTGLITLTEQCSDVDERALSFYYGSKTDTTFDDLELLPNFTDVPKSKRITNVTQNVMAQHHNNLKDALIAIQQFVGVQGTTDTEPLGSTMEGRINFLRNLVLSPKAWFTQDKRIGIIPFAVQFDDLSFRSPATYSWDFGDTGTSTLSDPSHTYTTAGEYDVTLTVTNSFGSDTIVIPKLIVARLAAPDEATISFTPLSSQTLAGGVLRSKTGSLVTVSVDDDGEQAGDPIVQYTWNMGDDLSHLNSTSTKGLYSVGGIYDIKLRTDTTLGAYRITTFEDVIDIIETKNLWFFAFDDDTLSSSPRLSYSYEFGMISETFKQKSTSSLSVTRDYRFLDPSPPSTFSTLDFEDDREVREFLRNNSFSPNGLTASGSQGTALLYWSQGGDEVSVLSSQTIKFAEYNGFNDSWSTPTVSGTPPNDEISRAWNWIGLNSPSFIHLILGVQDSVGGVSPTNQDHTAIDLLDLSSSSTTFSSSDYKNAANELENNISGSTSSVYRSAWKGSSGYFVRNAAIGSFFRIASFYRTEGVITNEVQIIRKLADIPGDARLEGQLVSLTSGIYFFYNSGDIAVYNTTTNIWSTGGPGTNSVSFQSLQDATVVGFSDVRNTLLAASDGDRKVYLSFDYSTDAFIKFNETDLTFSKLVSRPAGEQWILGVY